MIESIVFEHAPFFYTKIGRWWGSNPILKRQEEIDVCALDKKNILLGECKWTNHVIDKSVLDDLQSQGTLFPQKNQYYYLFAKTGFSETVKEAAQQQTNIFLITIDDIYHHKYPYMKKNNPPM